MRLFLTCCFWLFLSSWCFSQTVHLSGKIYLDSNRNGKFDQFERLLKGTRVLVYKENVVTQTVFSDSNGVYNLSSEAALIRLLVVTPELAYEPVKNIILDYRQLKDAAYDTLDFVFKRNEPVTAVYMGIAGLSTEANELLGGVREAKVGLSIRTLLPEVSIRLSIDYDSLLTFYPSEREPVLQRPGHIEWIIDGLRNEGMFSFKQKIHIPFFQDTLQHLTFKMTATAALSTDDSVFTTLFYHQINHWASFSSGPSKGIKWLRSFKWGEDNPAPYYSSVQLDTALGGQHYFVLVDKLGEKFVSLSKIDDKGLTIWQSYPETGQSKTFGGIGITHTRDSGCLVVVKTVDAQLVFLKFNKNGIQQWRKTVTDGKSMPFRKISIIEVLEGGYMLTGSTLSHEGVFANNIGPDMDHNENLYIMRLNAEGEVLWAKVYGGSNKDVGEKIVPLSNGSYIVLSNSNSADGDVVALHKKPANGFNNMETWVLNIDSKGDILWKRCYGGSGDSFLYGVAENNGGLLFSGSTNSKDGDIPFYSGIAADLWLLQTNPIGDIQWSKVYPKHKAYTNFYDFQGDFTTHLRKKKDGTFITAGTVLGKVGDIRASHANRDVVIVNIDSAGNILRQKAIGGTNSDYVDDMVINIHDEPVVGFSTSSIDDDLYEPLSIGTLGIVCKIGITNTIKGQAFIDNNRNHQKDANEPYYNEGRIYTAKGSDTTIARIFNGQFLSNVDTGNYITTYVSPNSYFTISPASKTSSFTSFDQEDSVDFALVPKPNIKDLQVSLTPLTPARPGFGCSYRIITKNVGTATIANAVISFKKDGRQTYTAASRTHSGISADSIWWGPRSLAAFQSDTLDITLTNAVPPGLQNGDTLTLVAYALPLTGDTTAANNIARFKQVVQGSYDPNDKTEAHAGIYTPAMKASKEPFQYLIRFQNTGTDTAFFITVKDTLDERVSLSSLETITTSHPYKFSIDGRIATWQFDKILLVDSTTNEPKSHGYISFTIQPSASLQVGDSVTNKAAIYFDYNLPIITNEALVAMISAGCPKGNTWTGIVSTAWENPNNWSCGSVPTETTDVLIKAGTPRQPVVNSSTKVNSITAGTGAQLMVKAGVVLQVNGM